VTGPCLLAVAPSPFVTVQDGGRQGWQRFGVSGCGAMDMQALAAANLLVGNPPDAGALEFAYAAGEWRLEAASCRIAVAGGGFRVRIGERVLPVWRSVTLRRGDTLRVDGGVDAVWGYVAVAGGIDLPRELGSLSTHVRSGVGGWHGRTLQAGDVLPLVLPDSPGGPEHALPPRARGTGPLRVVLGPQDDYFHAEAIETFLSAPFEVSQQIDRLGYRLVGPVLEHAKGFNIISDGVVPGCIQVPGDGKPIVLMRDCQPPGGYPKIATLISADFAGLAQSRPGTTLHFRQVGIAEAQLLRRRMVAAIAAMPEELGEIDESP
jgi:biotin-dependent carboxylase-like uncharacterized protein